MDSSSSNEVVFEFPPLFRIYKDGHIERLINNERVPPSTDPHTGVQSKDIVISPETDDDVSARLFMPKITNPTRKLPLLIYIHGGAFCIETPFSPFYHNYTSSLAAEANIVIVSVHYRRAPEHPLPIAYEDTWTAIQWIASHAASHGGVISHEPWLTDHVDFSRVFLSGDSAGANIAHNMAMRASVNNELDGVEFVGMVLVHPFFGNNKPDKLLTLIFPSATGCDDPRINPAADLASLKSGLGCGIKVLVCVAGKDGLRKRGRYYYEALKKSGWGGVVEIVETYGEDHVFHLFNPSSENAVSFLKLVATFMNRN